jgi:predicted secreted protein
MSTTRTALVALCTLCVISFSSHAELQDQGLNSILQIIDKAIDDVNMDKQAENYDAQVVENATAAIITLSKTLGNLSYSRLQCGQADVLAEFTQRVQNLPEESRNPMRDAFQEGFDKSKEETVLLSDDECKRLTESRTREEIVDDALVDVEEEAEVAAEEVVEEPDLDEPRKRLMRMAELSGQLAFKTMFCDGKQVFTRDYNEFMKTVPEEFEQEVKDTYWKGYKHGKRMNPYLTADACL